MPTSTCRHAVQKERRHEAHCTDGRRPPPRAAQIASSALAEPSDGGGMPSGVVAQWQKWQKA